jgi:hypothetical protein
VFTTASLIEREVERNFRLKSPNFDPTVLQTDRYRRWVEARIEDARRRGELLTEQQYLDLRIGRVLRVGDRARYVGPTRLEPSPFSGKLITRPEGQLGTVTHVMGPPQRPIFSFMPDVPPDTRKAAADGLDVEVLRLETADWTLFERIV